MFNPENRDFRKIREVVPIFHKEDIMFHLILSFWHSLLLLFPLFVTLLEFWYAITLFYSKYSNAVWIVWI